MPDQTERQAIVLFWDECDLVEVTARILAHEFRFECSWRMVSRPEAGVPSLVADRWLADSLFSMVESERQTSTDVIVLLASAAIETGFGYPLAAECRGNTIAISTVGVNPKNLVRVLRHELGHLFGLKEHLDCVMSRYQVEDPGFCGACVDYLRGLGIEWRAAY
jgi:hypothetical protein